MEDVREAFRKLILTPSGQALSRSDLFGAMSSTTWTRLFMDRCAARGLITKESRGLNGKSFFLPTPDLKRYVEDDGLLSGLIWPGPKSHEENEFVDSPVAPSHANAVEEIKWIESTALVEDSVTIEETVRASLKINYAILQNLSYVREKIELLEAAIEELREAWR